MMDLKGAKILLVDDTQANLDILCQVLEPEGYSISMAPNGEVALRIVGRVMPDLILLDVMMPGINGFDVCRKLKVREKTRDIPVIFITAENPTESVVTGFDVGGVDYILKPFREQEVLVRVRNVLTTRFLLKENCLYQEKMERELQTAHDLQMGLMPKQSPCLEGLDMTGRCLPAEHVGGDFFQYYEQPDGSVAIVLADVTGHAMQAAIPMVLFNGILDTQMEFDLVPEELFDRLNRSLVRLLDRRTFVCFLMAHIDASRKCMRIINAGFPYPYLHRSSGGELIELQTDETYPLGIVPSMKHSILEVGLQLGDQVVFCSDGLIEATDEKGNTFGYTRIAQTIQATCGENEDSDSVLGEILQSVDLFANKTSATDDRTCVVVRIA